MTGYGCFEGLVAGQSVSVEIRSLNHRYRDIRLSLPRQWLALEVEVERTLRTAVGRGRIECVIRSNAPSCESMEVMLDEQRMHQVFDAYTRIAELLGLEEAPSLSMIARSEGVLSFKSLQTDLDAVQSELLPLVAQALRACDDLRRSEGDRLRQEIEDRIEVLTDLLRQIGEQVPEQQLLLNKRTEDRIRKFSSSAEVSEDRLVQELAVLAERSDVTEELSRLQSHVEQFLQLLSKRGPIGRELDFVTQEMNREINTLCSKFHCVEVVRQAVSARAELEKIREQIQNVE